MFMIAAGAVAPRTLDAQAGAASRPESKPVLFRVFKTGEEKKAVWNIAHDNLQFGTDQVRTLAREMSIDYRKNTLKLDPKDRKFTEAFCDSLITIEAEAGAPFGYVHMILEAFVISRFYNFELIGPAGKFNYSVPTDAHVSKIERAQCLWLSLNFIEGQGVVRGVGMAQLKEVKNEEEMLTEAEAIWKKTNPSPGVEKVAVFSVSSSMVPWKDVFNVWKQLYAKGVGEVELRLPDNTLFIKDRPRTAK